MKHFLATTGLVVGLFTACSERPQAENRELPTRPVALQVIITHAGKVAGVLCRNKDGKLIRSEGIASLPKNTGKLRGRGEFLPPYSGVNYDYKKGTGFSKGDNAIIRTGMREIHKDDSIGEWLIAQEYPYIEIILQGGIVFRYLAKGGAESDILLTEGQSNDGGKKLMDTCQEIPITTTPHVFSF